MDFLLVLFALVAMSLAQNVQDDLIRLHNIDRTRHQVGPLSGNSDLVRKATNCAQRSADRGYIAHDCPNQSGHGENLAMSTGVITAARAYQLWYDEYKLYDYNKPGFSSATGHFTQVVWKGSSQIGCGYAKNRISVISCLYSPPGNYQGQFPQNVFPPRA